MEKHVTLKHEFRKAHRILMRKLGHATMKWDSSVKLLLLLSERTHFETNCIRLAEVALNVDIISCFKVPGLKFGWAWVVVTDEFRCFIKSLMVIILSRSAFHNNDS